MPFVFSQRQTKHPLHSSPGSDLCTLLLLPCRSLGKDFKKPNGSSAHFLRHNSNEYLVLTFLGGVLLTLLLMALVFLIIKSYRKCHSSPRVLDPHSVPPAEFSPPEEALTYANMTFKISKKKSNHLTMNHSSDSDSIVYAQIKVTNSPCLSSEV
ncbi:transmembrane protein C1orf162 homolog [Balaenoptera acutorostrata]|uniref:Transmembrane protein C1orf162 homolog n=1 Tax=Balaenoptera acutorostrata TaxID=9767 RepID=A0A452C7R6_BALAC|nr:transmembrane protein C1orf162 homolog [Balaenoptera acutorostrata]